MQDPPIRNEHRLIECPRRLDAQFHDFSPSALDEIQLALIDQKEALGRALEREQEKIVDRPEKGRDNMLEFSGAIKVLDRCDLLASPKPPPAPPALPFSIRDDYWGKYVRRWEHLSEQFTLMTIRQLPLEEALRSWGRLRAAEMMTPLPCAVASSPKWLIHHARSIGLDLENTASDHMLIPAVIELSRAPLPEHWTFLSKAAQASFPRVEAKSGPTEDSPSSTKYYRNIMTGMETSVHPSAPCMQRIVMGIRRRMNGKKRILSSWVQFSGGSKCFFYNFRTGRRQDDFPNLKLLPNKWPPRQLQPAEKLVAEVANTCWPNLRREALVAAVKKDAWKPCEKRRADLLSRTPCPLEHLAIRGLHIGIDCALHRDLMWLTELVMAPEMPLGWAKSEGGYFWHAACGLAMWTHPVEALVMGIVERLVKERAAAMQNIIRANIHKQK